MKKPLEIIVFVFVRGPITLAVSAGEERDTIDLPPEDVTITPMNRVEQAYNRETEELAGRLLNALA